LGYSRQNLYKQAKEAARQKAVLYQVKQLIDQQRKLLSRCGTKKLYHLIKSELASLGLKVGRDKLFEIMRHYGLLIRPAKRYVQTTMSKHWLRKWPNLIKEQKITHADQVWVSDITYLKTQQGACYLNLITDMFSRKIVGYAVADNMEAETMATALKMAIANRLNPAQLTIHHSDRGLQYCSKEYAELTRSNNIQLSMTENGDPYENALAERMNRTLKEEFGLYRKMDNLQQAKLLVAEGVELYNSKRPHLALQMSTPDQVYKAKIPAA